MLNKVKLNEINMTLSKITDIGELVVENERYTLHDLHLNELTVSLTELKPFQSTRGHSHVDSDEIYFFTYGHGKIQIDKNEYDVEKGSIIIVQKGEFHRVINSNKEKLVFVAVFTGKRSSKKYNYSG